jgi:hypothetical protein
MTVTPDNVVHIFSAVLQAMIAANEARPADAPSHIQKARAGKLVPESLKITIEAVATLRNAKL